MTSPTPEQVIADAKQAITTKFANVANLPEWMQVRALGCDMRPFGELAVEALHARGFTITGPDEVPVPREAIDELRRAARLQNDASTADAALDLLARLGQP